jgi:hypothetical protein
VLSLERHSLPLLPACSGVQLGNLAMALRRFGRAPPLPWMEAFAAAGARLLREGSFERVPLAMTLYGVEAWAPAPGAGLPWWDDFVSTARTRWAEVQAARGAPPPAPPQQQQAGRRRAPGLAAAAMRAAVDSAEAAAGPQEAAGGGGGGAPPPPPPPPRG